MTSLFKLDPMAGSAMTERSMRSMPRWMIWLGAIGLVALSMFHLYGGTFGEAPAMVQLSVHLSFGVFLAFLLFGAAPALSREDMTPRRFKFAVAWRIGSTVGALAITIGALVMAMSRRGTEAGATDSLIVAGMAGLVTVIQFTHLMGERRGLLLLINVSLGLLATFAVGYVGVNYEDLAQRAAFGYNTMDMFVAAVGLVLILEATRRSVSPALTGVTIAFLAFAMFGHHLPNQMGDIWLIGGLLPDDVADTPLKLGHPAIRPALLLQKEFYSTEGIFGIPLTVSATFVFLFVLFGAFLEKSGAGQYLIDVAFSTMGRYRGGPAKAAVIASGMMGTISGSSIANTVSTGSLTIPLMKKAGFKPETAAAVEVAASTNGQLMPPVMGAAAFIMAEFTGIPYSDIIIAALLPALLSYTAIFTMIHLEAARDGLQAADPATVKPLARTLFRGMHLNIPLVAVVAFMMPFAWPGGMKEQFGFPWTPGTSATWAIWITLGVFTLVAMLLPRSAYGMDHVRGDHYWRRPIHLGARTWQALRDGALNMVGIACACACCGIIIGVVNETGLSSKITDLVAVLSFGKLLPALILTAMACIMLGIGLPTTATYIIMAALTVPALLQIAHPSDDPIPVSVLLAGHLFVFYYGIMADDTPPVGLCAYAAAGIAGSDPFKTGLKSFRFDLAAFTLPVIFFLNPELLLQDVTWRDVIWLIPAAIIGMMTFAAVLQGYLWDRLRWWERLLLLAVSFLLVTPDLVHSLIGLGLGAVVLLFHRFVLKPLPAKAPVV